MRFSCDQRLLRPAPARAVFGVFWVVIGTLWACTPGARGPVFVRGDEDLEALNHQAGELLLSALREPTSEALALRELNAAGVAGMPWVSRALAASVDRAPSDALLSQLLFALAARGDEDAAARLRSSDSSDPVALSMRLRLLNVDDDRSELLAALRHASEHVRSAALLRLRQGSLDDATEAELVGVARLDPVAAVRAQALEALSAADHAAFEVLSERLTDADPLPRAVAMRELARRDCARAGSTLAHFLSDAPSRDGLAAVRALVPCGEPMLASNLDALRRALSTSDVRLRAEAATTADALSWRSVPDWLATPLAHDPVPAIRLALAAAVRRTQPELASKVLRDLAAAHSTMVALQAASLLAEDGDQGAVDVLLSARSVRDASMRRVAFVALARLGVAPRYLQPGLADGTLSVRLAAAGALLRLTQPLL